MPIGCGSGANQGSSGRCSFLAAPQRPALLSAKVGVGPIALRPPMAAGAVAARVAVQRGPTWGSSRAPDARSPSSFRHGPVACTQSTRMAAATVTCTAQAACTARRAVTGRAAAQVTGASGRSPHLAQQGPARRMADALPCRQPRHLSACTPPGPRSHRRSCPAWPPAAWRPPPAPLPARASARRPPPARPAAPPWPPRPRCGPLLWAFSPASSRMAAGAAEEAGGDLKAAPWQPRGASPHAARPQIPPLMRRHAALAGGPRAPPRPASRRPAELLLLPRCRSHLPRIVPCVLPTHQIGDTLEEFLLEATPDPKLRQLMMSMSEAIRTIAYKVLDGCWTRAAGCMSAAGVRHDTCSGARCRSLVPAAASRAQARQPAAGLAPPLPPARRCAPRRAAAPPASTPLATSSWRWTCWPTSCCLRRSSTAAAASWPAPRRCRSRWTWAVRSAPAVGRPAAGSALPAVARAALRPSSRRGRVA